MEIKTVSLKDYSSLRIGGEGKLIEVKSEEEIREAVMYAKQAGLRVYVVGGGTNTYFGEDLLGFLFIHPTFQGVTFEDQGDSIVVQAYANEVWDNLVKKTVEKNLWGLENLSYIPGTVGGAPVQNIGAYGVELKEVFVSLRAYDTTEDKMVTFTHDTCHFGYRDSVFKYNKNRYIIIEVALRLQKEGAPTLHYKPLDELKSRTNLTLQDIRNAVIDIRKRKLPNYNEHPNCGSFFKNPVVDQETAEHLKTLYQHIPLIETLEGYKIPAAWLIENIAEMKGVRLGDVGLWPYQPLVIVNYGQATASNVDALADQVRKRIGEKTGIVLEQEVNRVE